MHQVRISILAFVTLLAVCLSGCTVEGFVAGQAAKYVYKKYKASKDENKDAAPPRAARLKGDAFLLPHGFGLKLVAPGSENTPPTAGEHLQQPSHYRSIKGVISSGTGLSDVKATASGADGTIDTGDFQNKRVNLDAVQDRLEYLTQ